MVCVGSVGCCLKPEVDVSVVCIHVLEGMPVQMCGETRLCICRCVLHVHVYMAGCRTAEEFNSTGIIFIAYSYM